MQILDFENRERMSGMSDSHHLEALRRMIQEESKYRHQCSVGQEASLLDHSVKDAVNQQISTVLKEITNRDDSARVHAPSVMTSAYSAENL
jgi:hypothetical protein